MKMIEKLKRQLLETQKETDLVYRLEQLKILDKKILLLLINSDTKSKNKNKLDNLLKSICNN
jgi:hypothetical protein